MAMPNRCGIHIGLGLYGFPLISRFALVPARVMFMYGGALTGKVVGVCVILAILSAGGLQAQNPAEARSCCRWMAAKGQQDAGDSVAGRRSRC